MTTTAIPPAPPRDRRHVRHSPRTIALARRMYGDGDAWTPTQIRRYLGTQGVPVPSESTLRRWVIPAEAEASRQAAALANRRRRAIRARIVELRFEVGLSHVAIARLVRHDHGVEAEHVDFALVKRVCAEHEAARP